LGSLPLVSNAWPHAAAAAAAVAAALQLLRAAVGWIQRDRAASELSIMMLVGLPNSGKSSLINAFKLSAKAAGAAVCDCASSWRQGARPASCGDDI
jgi:ribosome biogenesis GTPase A